MAHAEKIGDSPAVRSKIICAVVLFYIDKNALDLNYYSYVVEATLENRCMHFQDYHYIVRKGAEKMYRVLPSSDTNLENELTGRSNRKREYAARTQFDC